MALLTLEYVKVVAEYAGSITVKGGETVSSRPGKYLRIDATTGKAMLGNATAAGEVGGLHGVAMTSERYVGDSVTLLRHGLMDWGDALDGMDFGASIFVSDTDGTFADAAGTVSTVAGRVYPVFEADGTVKRLALIDLR